MFVGVGTVAEDVVLLFAVVVVVAVGVFLAFLAVVFLAFVVVVATVVAGIVVESAVVAPFSYFDSVVAAVVPAVAVLVVSPPAPC